MSVEDANEAMSVRARMLAMCYAEQKNPAAPVSAASHISGAGIRNDVSVRSAYAFMSEMP